MTDETTDPRDEAAIVLLTAIISAAPGAQRQSSTGLESLAKAYAAVMEAMPKESVERGVWSA